MYVCSMADRKIEDEKEMNECVRTCGELPLNEKHSTKTNNDKI